MIDRQYLAEQTADDVGLQHELLTMFLGQVRNLQAMLDEALAPSSQGNATVDLPDAIHRIRGAAAAVGAWDLAAALGRTEAILSHDPVASGARNALGAVLRDAANTLAGLIAAFENAGLANSGESR